MIRTVLLLLLVFLALPSYSRAQEKSNTSTSETLIAPYFNLADWDSTVKPTAGVSDDYVDIIQEPYLLSPIDSDLHYPATAAQAGVEGKVTLAALLMEDGCISKVVVEKSDSKLLNDEAIRLMRQARFSPALEEEKPVEVWITKSIEFKLPVK